MARTKQTVRGRKKPPATAASLQHPLPTAQSTFTPGLSEKDREEQRARQESAEEDDADSFGHPDEGENVGTESPAEGSVEQGPPAAAHPENIPAPAQVTQVTQPLDESSSDSNDNEKNDMNSPALKSTPVATSQQRALWMAKLFEKEGFMPSAYTLTPQKPSAVDASETLEAGEDESGGNDKDKDVDTQEALGVQRPTLDSGDRPIECSLHHVGKDNNLVFSPDNPMTSFNLHLDSSGDMNSYYCKYLPPELFVPAAKLVQSEQFLKDFRTGGVYTSLIDWDTGVVTETKDAKEQAALSRGRYFVVGGTSEHDQTLKEKFPRYNEILCPLVDALKIKLESYVSRNLGHMQWLFMETLNGGCHQIPHSDFSPAFNNLDIRVDKQSYIAVIPLSKEWSMTRLDLLTPEAVELIYSRNDVGKHGPFLYDWKENESDNYMPVQQCRFTCTPPGAAIINNVHQFHGGHYGPSNSFRLFVFFSEYPWEDYSLFFPRGYL